MMGREFDPTDLIDVQTCKACVTLGANHVPSEGGPGATVMAIGQYPGAKDLELKRTFAGPAGELMNQMLAVAGLTRDQVYFANALKCRPPANRSGHPKELSTCYDWWLQGEIKLVDAPIVLLLGKDAYTAVIANQLVKLPDMTEERAYGGFKHGNVIKSNERLYVVSYHPSYFLRRASAGGHEAFLEFGEKLKEVVDGLPRLSE